MKTGFIIFHEGYALRVTKGWDDLSGAHIWTASEVNGILMESSSWESPPTHVQRATKQDDGSIELLTSGVMNKILIG